MSTTTPAHAEHYATLELPPGASPEAVHAQYRRLAKLYHPDRNPARRAECEEHLRRLNDAYHALTAPPTPALLPPPPAPAPVRPRPARGRLLGYIVAVAGICAVSIAYTALQAPGRDAAVPQVSAPLADVPPTLPPPAPASPDLERAELAARFALISQGTDQTLTQASGLVARVNRETGHAPQSVRPQRAEQLEADTLELSRLRETVRAGLRHWQPPSSAILYHAQIADLQAALTQMQQQRVLVAQELAAFPAR